MKFLRKVGHIIGNVISPIPEWWRSAFLFVLTFVTTTAAGAYQYGAHPFDSWFDFSMGLTFSLPLLFILSAHEMGHYLMCKKYGIPSTPPYFLPLPSGPEFVNLGTLGAFIRIKSLIPHRQALLMMGAAGPLAGLVATIPIYIAGLITSPWQISGTAGSEEGLLLGNPLLAQIIQWIYYGRSPDDLSILYNHIAFAGWIGMLVTLLNLLPVGQLDGGHIMYALLGRHHEKIAKVTIYILIALSLLWPGWLVWVLLLTRVIGVSHPPTVWDEISLTPSQQLVGILSVVSFLILFMPSPLSVYEWWDNLNLLWHLLY